MIKLKQPYKIGVKKFDKLKDKHKITSEERKKWWCRKEVLYAYDFELITAFDEPRKIKTENKGEIIKNFKYLGNIELIKDISTYSPKKASNVQLADDWRIVMAWYSTKKSGGKLRHSLEDIINLARAIYLEIKDRVEKGKMKHDFKPDKMSKFSKELFNIVSKGKTGIENADLSDLKNLNQFEDKTIIKDFISVIGSVVEQKKDNPKDLDLLIRMSKPNDYLKRAIETRILKDLDFKNDVHFVWGDAEGPHDTFIPLYDLKLRRIKPMKRVEMNEKIIENTSSHFIQPMKPSKTFYDIDETIDYMFDNGNKFAIEKKYDGYRAQLVKKGDSIKIFSISGEDVSKHFDKIRNEATNLTSEEVILDGELVYKKGGRSEIAKFITGEEEYDDDDITFWAFDCLLKGEEKLVNEEFINRKSKFPSLNFSKHIREVNSIIVASKSEAKKAIKLVRNLPGSEGAMIKKYKSIYNVGGESSSWIKLRNIDKISVRILKVNDKERGHTFTMGIKAPDDAKEKYVKDGWLDIGDTFVTDLNAKEGDKIIVSVEEVWRHEYKDGKIRYSVHKPRVLKKSDKDLTSWGELDKLVVSKGESIKENVKGEDKERESETRTDAATKFWNENWHNMYPKDGKGKYVYQHHWRGLTEEESKMSDKELLKTDNSLHGDFRGEVNNEKLWGFTVFLGEVEDNKEKDGDKLIYLSKHKKSPEKIQGNFKLAIPHSWLEVGEGKGTVSDPEGVGSTSEKWAKFFILDEGDYEIGVWRKHFYEVFVDGKELKGRMTIAYVPIDGSRKWLVNFPKDQTPYAEKNDKEKIIKEIKGKKNQRYLIWSKPGEKPEKIDTSKR